VQAATGVDAARYFRPPYGNHNSTVDAVAAALGTRRDDAVVWDAVGSAVIAEDFIIRMAERSPRLGGPR
jgi:peptidoglycan/xylan/chitin deacetylase (PgdA/CDA1 family)